MTAFDYRIFCDMLEDDGLRTVAMRDSLNRVLCRFPRSTIARYGYGDGRGGGGGDGYGYGDGNGDGDGDGDGYGYGNGNGNGGF